MLINRRFIMNKPRVFQLLTRKLDNPFKKLFNREDLLQIPKKSETVCTEVQTKLNSNLAFGIKLLPRKICIDIRCIQDRLIEQSGIKNTSKSKPDILEILTTDEYHQLAVDESTSLETNLPFILFRLKIGSSDRLYLFYTLSNKVYESYTKKDFNFIKNKYFKAYSSTKESASIQLSATVGSYDFQAFLNDKNNIEFINSITLLPDFQKRLSEITGIKQLAYIHPSSLFFKRYTTDSLDSYLEEYKVTTSKELLNQGGRIDYKAHTHVGLKPLLLGNSILPYIDELEEIYWLNTNNYHSSGEKLQIKEDRSKIKYYTQNGHWIPSLEELIKIGFADFLVFKTYRPSSIVPANLSDYTLAFFSTLYLIDFIGRGAIQIDPQETTAYSILLYICNRLDQTDSGIKTSPNKVELNLHHSEYLYFKHRQDKVELFPIEEEYAYYKIRPLDFIPYLEESYNSLGLELRTENRAMFKLVFNSALKKYVNTYRENHNFISKSEAETMLESLCTLNGVDPLTIRGMYHIPEKMYLQEYTNLTRLVKLYANSQENIY